MNESVLELSQLALKYKNQFNYHKSYVIDKNYYKDLFCAFENIGINIRHLLDKIVVYAGHQQTSCKNKKINKKSNKGIASQLMIVLKRPVKDTLPTQSDKFLIGF